VDKGIRVLSELNVALALGLILFVLFMGDTSFLLNALVLNVGDYVNRFMGMTLNSFAFDRPVEWMNNWTLFFWAWWVAWSPFVGLFLARISRGRTIRQFVMGTLIIPFTFTLLWLSVFGNSALYEIIHGNAAFARRRWRTRSAASTACWRSTRRLPLAPRWRPLPACCSTSPPRIPARWCWGTSPRS
jgi:choline/glycine/proline betaine transport protein